MDLKNYAPLRQFWDDRNAWSVATFGPVASRGPDGPLKHLIKECDEVLAETDPEKRKEEIVDCLFLTFDAANRTGMTWVQVQMWLNADRTQPLSYYAKEAKRYAGYTIDATGLEDKVDEFECLLICVASMIHEAFSSPEELLAYCYRKLEKNKARTWNVPKDGEPVEHVRTPEEQAVKQVETAQEAKSPDKLVSVYQRHITERLTTKTITVDVYDIAEAYQLSHPLGHAIKKILVAGGRGAKSRIVDLQEAMASIQIEIDFINTHGG